MYVQFELVNEHIHDPVNLLESALRQWSQQYQIHHYRTKIFKGHLRLTFEQPQHYSMFAMTWNPEQLPWFKFVLIEPMQTRQP